MFEKTVAAISTPIGAGGIAVIRISGDEAVTIADKCFKAYSGKPLSALKGYSALYGQIIDGERVIDDCVALVFIAPKSYTGENVVEISVHGGRIVARDALRTILENGAFLAPAGEFTKRAFLNGKLDLASAESIMEIISAKNETALRISRGAKEGKISKEIEKITDKLLELCASMAVYADYPDEEIDNLNPDNFLKVTSEISFSLSELIKGYDVGKIIREGIDCCIVGKPNVGKSTLMNLLCRADRSIVTDIAGTTRDIVESTVDFNGISLNLSDTAGLHDTDDIVEIAGVQKSRSKLESAAIVFAVFDLSRPFDEDDRLLLDALKNNAIILLNKSDISVDNDLSIFNGKKTIFISAKENKGIDELYKAVSEYVNTDAVDNNDAVLISERQRDCAKRALDSIIESENALKCGMTLDAVGVCLDDCLSALLELTGKRVTDEVSDEVFKRFCVGK